MALPKIDYTSKDFTTIRSDLINLIPQVTNKWTDYNASDLGVVLLELFAYMGDIVNTYIDRIANESYLSTAQSRQSIAELVKMLGYELSPMSAAVGDVEVRSALATIGDTLTKGFKVKTKAGVQFETYGDALFAEYAPYMNAKENSVAEPYPTGMSTKITGFTINASTLNVTWSNLTNLSGGLGADDLAWRINFNDATAYSPGDITAVQAAFRAWTWNWDNAGARLVDATSSEYILVDAEASFKDYLKGCYIKKGSAFSAIGYEGIIEDVIDSNTLRCSGDTRTLTTGDSPAWATGEQYAIKVVPAIVYVANGVKYLKIQGVPATGTANSNLVITDDNSGSVTTGGGFLAGVGFVEGVDYATPVAPAVGGVITIAPYKAARPIVINSVSKSEEPLGTSNGKAFQRFRLSMNDLTHHLAFKTIPEGFEIAVEVDEGSGYVTWTRVETFMNSTFVDRHYKIKISDLGKAFIVFGDNVNGQIPANSSPVRATYMYGGGVTGNVGAYTIDTLVSDAPNGDSAATVRNFEVTRGGQTKETLLSAKINAPRYIRTLDRAITPADFKFLSDKFPGVAVSTCQNIAGTVAIYVRILPENWDGSTSGWNTLITDLTVYLDTKKVVGTTVIVTIPTALPIHVEYNLIALPGYDKEQVNVNVQNKIQEYLNPLRMEAETEQYYLSIGEDVYLDEMTDLIRAIEGIKFFQVTHFNTAVNPGTPVLSSKIAVSYTQTLAQVRYFGSAIAGSITNA
tara:strand:- start:1390 stop:3615 length:2226 start_codon:yes stop_codon:yes gene_type:complete